MNKQPDELMFFPMEFYLYFGGVENTYLCK